MILFRLISWPYIRKHALRSLLTVAGIVIGVSVFFAMHAANESVFHTFEQTVRRIAGATELQITAGEPGFSEDVLERVQALPQIAVAAPAIEAVAGTGLAGQGNLLILGVDMTGDRSLRDYEFEGGDAAVIDDPLVFLAQPDSIMLTAGYAHRNNLGISSNILLDTANGKRSFTVRGLLKSSGFASAFGGNLAVMDIYAAQQVFGRGRRFDRIDIMLNKGVSVKDGQATLRALLGPGFEVQPPASRGQSFQSMLRIYYYILNFSSAFALIVGMFIIYSSFSIAVTMRRKEIGILRALGATRRQIATLFLGESAIGGLIGSTLGVLIGFGAAGLMAKAIGTLLQGVYGLDQGGVAVTPSATLIGLTIGLGAVTSMVAAGVPARNAASIDPIQALQRGGAQSSSNGRNPSRVIAACVCASAGGILLAATRSLQWFYAGYVLVLLAALLLTPVLTQFLARAMRWFLQRLRPVEGVLAADSLITSSRRTGATIGALMLSLALVIGLAGTARSSYDSIMSWVSAALNSDFFVSSSPTLSGNNYRFPASMESQIAAIDGIANIYSMRTARIQFQGETILLVVPETDKLAALSPPPPVEGKSAEMFRLLAAGQGVIGSESFASLRHFHLGDPVDLPTPSGNLRLPLVGIIREYSDQNGELFLDRAVYQRYWHDDTVDHFCVFLKPGAVPAGVRSAILGKFSSNRQMFVLSNREVRKYIGGLADQWFGITWVQ
ncbi:MAG: ABC transporter permease, partial [Bryobacteraceae bacterium]